MRESCFLGFIGALGLAACAIWSQPAPAQGTAITSSPAPDSPFGKCNTTDPKGFDKNDKFNGLDAAGKEALLTSGLPCSEILSAPFTLENIQRGFDFNSWLTFIALNAPEKA